MSIAAYRINRLEHEHAGTFDLCCDKTLHEILDDAGFLDSLYEGVGIIYLDISFIRERILPNVYGGIKDSFLKDLDWAQMNDVDTIPYFCM